ncbi:MAG: hypothetical protein WAU68_00800 [Vitreimonas sp.]
MTESLVVTRSKRKGGTEQLGLFAQDGSAPLERPRARMITVADMPHYAPELHAIIDAVLASLSRDRALLTYRAIQQSFGISRATVARRVKEGLVPGIRVLDGRVLDDGSVRRFDRTQLHWLLLAVRYGRNTT